jgi:8-oxo-dGTP pyrophosphatase MutT (NUDIX family)
MAAKSLKKKPTIDRRELRDNKARKSYLQVGALCYRHSKSGVKILLVTSRETRRWIVPKGWPMKRRTASGAAAREAWEEAGARGDVSVHSMGFFTYRKDMGRGSRIHCTVRVFPMQVTEILKKFPEAKQRKVKWFSQKKAAQKVREPELKLLIRSFAPAQIEELAAE